MKNGLYFNLSVDESSHTIVVKRVFAAPLALVWEAWTKAEILDQWWSAKDWTCHTKSMEFKEGGQRHYQVLGPEGEVFWGITTYEEIRIHLAFSGQECFADEQAVINTEYPQSNYHITFANQEDHTLIEHHTTYASMEALKASLQYGFEKGTVDAYDKLDHFLAER